MARTKKPVELVYRNANGTKTRQNVAKFAELAKELSRRGSEVFGFERQLHAEHKADLKTIMSGGSVPNCTAVYA